LKLKDEYKNFMEIIIKESKRLSQTMEQFLTYTFPSSFPKEKINLSEILRETLEILEKENEISKKSELKVKSDNSVFYYGNKEQFKQIFMHLITNSLKSFSNKGTIEINLFKKNNREIEIRVKDNGRGMSEEEKERIFEPFFSRFEKGKGLGMAIVYRIIQEYKGKIDIFSEQGKGTEIKIKLPVTQNKREYKGEIKNE